MFFFQANEFLQNDKDSNEYNLIFEGRKPLKSNRSKITFIIFLELFFMRKATVCMPPVSVVISYQDHPINNAMKITFYR